MVTLALLALSLAPTMTLSEGLSAPLYDQSENGLPAPPREKELRRRRLADGDVADGERCWLGITCNNCQNTASFWWSKSFTACGTEPKWQDGKKCSWGITCRACENEATWWSEKRSIACGSQPTPQPTPAPTTARPTNQPSAMPTQAPSLVPTFTPTTQPSASPTLAPTASPTGVPTTQPSASPTPAPTTASPTGVPTTQPSTSPTSVPTPSPTQLPLNGKCYELGSTMEERDAFCSGDLVCARAGFDERHFGGCHQKFGSDGDYEEGPGLFGIRHHCCSRIPDVANGTKCLTGSTRISTCFKCKNAASYWYSKRSYACGQEPAWENGKKCLLGTSCNRCENKAAWEWKKFSYVCGSETNSSD